MSLGEHRWAQSYSKCPGPLNTISSSNPPISTELAAHGLMVCVHPNDPGRVRPRLLFFIHIPGWLKAKNHECGRVNQALDGSFKRSALAPAPAAVYIQLCYNVLTASSVSPPFLFLGT